MILDPKITGKNFGKNIKDNNSTSSDATQSAFNDSDYYDASKYIQMTNTGVGILGDLFYDPNNYAQNFNYQPIQPGIGNRDAILNNNVYYEYQPIQDVSASEWVGDTLKNGLSVGLQTGNIWAGLGTAAATLIGKGVKQANINKENQRGRMYVDISNMQQPLVNNYALGQHDLLNRFYHSGEGGGNLHTHGATFDNGMTYFNVGGTHEQNPYGGILQGFNEEDGEPNLVEQGETKWNDYIFSNRYKAGGSLLKKYILPEEYAGMTFADISKKLSEHLEDTPGSVIEQNTTNAMLSRLMNAQEEKRAKDEENKAMREFKKGGHMFLWGGEDDYPLIYGDPVTVTLPSNYIDWQTIKQNNPQTYINTDDIIDSNLDWIDYNYIKPNTINNTSNIPSNSKYLVNNNNDTRNRFNPRYLTLLDSFASLLGDKLGITNQPDYGRSRMYRDAALNNIKNADITVPDLQEVTPNKIPIASLLNSYRSQYAGNAARLMDAANSNTTAALANLNANNMQYEKALGDLYINALMQENQDEARAAELNNSGRLNIAQLLQNNVQFNAQQGNNRYNGLKDYINDLSIQDALSSAAQQDTADTFRQSMQNYLMELEDKNVLAKLIASGALRYDKNTGAYYLDNDFLQQYV